MRIRRRTPGRYEALGILVAALACGEQSPTITPPERLPDISAAVTPSLLQELNAAGEFNLRPPTEVGDITPSYAKQLATAWARQFGPFIQSALSRDHGSPIEVAALMPCGRPVYAASPYALIEPDAPAYVVNSFGAYWLVPLCAPSGELQVSLGVAAQTQAQLRNGLIHFDEAYGNEFKPSAVPRGTEYPMTAERAARLAAATTGVRVAGVPELIRAERGYYPQYSRWRVPLETPVTARGRSSNTTAQLTHLFLGYAGPRTPEDAMIPLGDQPSVVDASFPLPIAAADQEPTYKTFHARVRAGRPLKFEGIVNPFAAR